MLYYLFETDISDSFSSHSWRVVLDKVVVAFLPLGLLLQLLANQCAFINQ